MRALSRALRQQGDPIPLPWPELPIEPRPGDVVMGLAAPGVGKSFVGLRWAHYLAKRGRPVLIQSTDTSLGDQGVRLAAMEYGVTTASVLLNQERYADRISELDLPIRWSDLFIGPEEMPDLIKAEIEFLGEVPALVVVDVVGDMLNGQEENVGAIRNIFTQLKKAARRNHTTILALHHVKRGPAANGTSVVKQADGLYGGEQVCPIILGMWREGTETLRVAVLKNRMGLGSADGLRAWDLKVDYAKAIVASRQAVWG